MVDSFVLSGIGVGERCFYVPSIFVFGIFFVPFLFALVQLGREIGFV